MFNIGDTVRIVGPRNLGEEYIRSVQWLDRMNEFIGHIAIITDITRYGGGLVYDVGNSDYDGLKDNEWWFVDEWLIPLFTEEDEINDGINSAEDLINALI